MLQAAFDNVKFLHESVKYLGFIDGIRYFRIYRRAVKDPNLVPRWAENCRKQAENPNLSREEKKMFNNFANVLIKHDKCECCAETKAVVFSDIGGRVCQDCYDNYKIVQKRLELFE